MCLVVLGWGLSETTPLVLLANRDEYLARPTERMRPWPEAAEIIAGKDLVGGGTWLGFNRSSRRLAVVTNVREPAVPATGAERSRGLLVTDFLLSNCSAEAFSEQLHARQNEFYQGYNLVLFDGEKLLCVSNRYGVTSLNAGIHGLSNAGLNSRWPKVERAKEGLQQALQQGASIDEMEVIMRNRDLVEDAFLPSTGVPLAWERRLARVFIDAEMGYGTRAMTSFVLGKGGEVVLREWSWDVVAQVWSLNEFNL